MNKHRTSRSGKNPKGKELFGPVPSVIEGPDRN